MPPKRRLISRSIVANPSPQNQNPLVKFMRKFSKNPGVKTRQILDLTRIICNT
ncbi:hypothetical protein CAMRE0001_2544 [Campylobacter rectus RM3267]|uniref:Uncharacterized protein n=2 Tax=Campylobacter rectus TaxID=203 RepID=A0A6G5QK83_CAMRE|nr:hypothetical protein CAMRE0001_2544 [Campylobacter rectus RM3267]QCD46105.1 hypothetical protein CRECT_0410 [Campylobacter rectus]